MKTFRLPLFAALFALSVAAIASAQTAPNPPPNADFEKTVQLKPIRLMAVQHQQTVKTFDSYARQTLGLITGRGTFHGQDPTFTVLDIAFRPRAYVGVNMIKIGNVPLRKDFQKLDFLSDEEKDRIIHEGTVSLELVSRPEVNNLLLNAQASDVRKVQGVQQLAAGMQTLDQLCGSFGGHDLFLPVAIVPPAKAGEHGWHKLIDIAGNDPDYLSIAKDLKLAPPKPLAGIDDKQAHAAVHAGVALFAAWQQQDAQLASNAAGTLADAVAAIDPAVYPSPLKRQVEVTYNSLAKMTLPGAACYFFALVAFIAAAHSRLPSLRLWGLRLMVLGLAVHTVGIGVRWWLVGSIPIKNEFESVMFSAWFGVVVGLGLELGLIQSVTRSVLGLAGGVRQMQTGTPVRNLFGAAASFVGWLSLIAIFTVPFVFGTNIGQEIGQSAGVLMSYWLYIHVTMVTASYALIGMGFLLSVWWLVRYYADRRHMESVSPRMLEGEARGFDVILPGGGGNGGAAAVSWPMTLAQLAFFPVAKPAPQAVVRNRAEAAVATEQAAAKVSFLAALDACNLVVLQMAFWVLGTGIMLGAVWADQSWGRFWGWDPKETFAVVTWIVYLVAVHIRVVTDRKAYWTAVLGSIGFFVMLFNWIGVNYFLKGLHSYAG